MASSLWERVHRLEDTIALLGDMFHRMRYTAPTTGELIGEMAGQERYQKLVFLRRCNRLMGDATPFPQAWRAACSPGESGLGPAEAAQLAALGEVLGQRDLESQLSALQGTRAQLERQLEELREEVTGKGKLYRSLGVLGGAAVLIILL